MIGFTREDGSEVRLEFLHHQQFIAGANGERIPIAVDYGKDTASRARTECRVFVTQQGQPRDTSVQIGHGNAFCSHLDVFNKEEGRRIALFRAVNEAEQQGLITRAERGTLLASYFNRPRGQMVTGAQTSTTSK